MATTQVLEQKIKELEERLIAVEQRLERMLGGAEHTMKSISEDAAARIRGDRVSD